MFDCESTRPAVAGGACADAQRKIAKLKWTVCVLKSRNVTRSGPEVELFCGRGGRARMFVTRTGVRRQQL